MNKLYSFFWVVISVNLISCSMVTHPLGEAKVQRPTKILVAQGFSQLKPLPHLTKKQNQFSREQSAKVVAYRNLAAQVYRENLTQDLIVGDQVIKAESFRVYLDLFLRQAKVIKSSVTYDRQVMQLQLSLTPRFYDCFSSTVSKVNDCLREDDKHQFTRIGYQTAAVSTVNVNCIDCSGLLSISGFSNEKHVVDNVLLSAGLYDSEWIGNMAVAAFIRRWFVTNYLFN